MLFERPVLVINIEDMGIELIGSVHSLGEAARDVLQEVDRFSPDYVCVELFRPLQPTRSLELELVRERYPDRLVCIDRHIDVTVSRYFSGTSPALFLKEALVRYFFLPFNVLSTYTYNLSPEIYKKLAGGRFFTFGWSERDSIAYIYERDEYMAGTLAELIKSGEVRGKCAVLVGRRHVPGMVCILEAFRSTGDIGSYYAGGRIYDVFNLRELNMPYTLSYEQSSRNFMVNRIIESAVKTAFMFACVLILFVIIAAMLLIATAILLTVLKSSI
jgi:hypothetical protein